MHNQQRIEVNHVTSTASCSRMRWGNLFDEPEGDRHSHRLLLLAGLHEFGERGGSGLIGVVAEGANDDAGHAIGLAHTRNPRRNHVHRIGMKRLPQPFPLRRAGNEAVSAYQPPFADGRYPPSPIGVRPFPHFVTLSLSKGLCRVVCSWCRTVAKQCPRNLHRIAPQHLTLLPVFCRPRLRRGELLRWLEPSRRLRAFLMIHHIRRNENVANSPGICLTHCVVILSLSKDLCRAVSAIADVTGHANGNDPIDLVPRQQRLRHHRRIQVPRARPHEVQLLPLVIADGNPVLREFNGLADNPDFPGKRALFGRQGNEDSRVGAREVGRDKKDSGDRKERPQSVKNQRVDPISPCRQSQSEPKILTVPVFMSILTKLCLPMTTRRLPSLILISLISALPTNGTFALLSTSTDQIVLPSVSFKVTTLFAGSTATVCFVFGSVRILNGLPLSAVETVPVILESSGNTMGVFSFVRVFSD